MISNRSIIDIGFYIGIRQIDDGNNKVIAKYISHNVDKLAKIYNN